MVFGFWVYTFLVFFFRALGDGHLGQMFPPLWEVLTRGLAHHESHVLLQRGGGADVDQDDEDDAGERGEAFGLLVCSSATAGAAGASSRVVAVAVAAAARDDDEATEQSVVAVYRDGGDEQYRGNGFFVNFECAG